jgi:hypothetical protein
VADFLDDRLPRVAAIARPAWRRVGAPLGLGGYWAYRRHFQYYREVVRLARTYVPAGGSVLDVGASDTMVLSRLDWFRRRVALDIKRIPAQPGAERVRADFLEYRPESPFDLVICLQVLEHQEEVEPFARKLLHTGRTVIVSVPYEWPAGRREGHPQDPISEAKLVGWMGRPPIETMVVRDAGADRLVAAFSGVAPK